MDGKQKKASNHHNHHEENALHNVLKAQYIVDCEEGQYKTIQSAIDAAEPNSIIKIAPGLYSENIKITKGGLRLEPKEKIGDIFIVVSQQPAILIALRKDERCTLVGLKLCHSGNYEDQEDFDRLIEDKELGMNLYGLQQEGPGGLGRNGDEEFVTKISVDEQMHCLILNNGGKLFMEDCQLSLK